MPSDKKARAKFRANKAYNTSKNPATAGSARRKKARIKNMDAEIKQNLIKESNSMLKYRKEPKIKWAQGGK